MSKAFKQGDRVKLSKLWLENHPQDAEYRGTISDKPQRGSSTLSKVKWDHKKVKDNYHNSFLELA